MVASFTGLLDRLNTLFSRDFLFAGFFPAAVFAGLSAGLAYWVWPGAREEIRSQLGASLGAQAPSWLAVFLLLLLLAFALWGLNPWLQRVLEGRGAVWSLLGGLRERLEAVQQREWSRLAEELRQAGRELHLFRRALSRSPTWKERLRAARKAGSGRPAAPEYRLPEGLQQAAEALDEQRRRRLRIPFDQAQGLVAGLEAELRSHPADDLAELDLLHVQVIELLAYAEEKLDSDYGRLWAEKKSRFPEDTARLGPTRLANVAEVHREYGFSRYGMDVEFVWPRLLKLVRADDKFYPVLEGAKTQLSFSVAMTFVAGLFTAVWGLLTLLTTPLVLPYLTVVLAGPLAVRLFYAVAVESHQAFSEVVRSAVDLFRFELLATLHLGLPADEAEEKELWQRLARPDPEQPLFYHHDKA